MKGDFLPYRVVFEYESGPKGRYPFSDYLSAELLAGEVGRRGAIVTVFKLFAPGDKKGDILAMFGPDQKHFFALAPGAHTGQAPYLRCECPFTTRDHEAAKDHMRNAGLCSECWGTTYVIDAVDKVGFATTCPVCVDGSVDEMSFHDVDTSAYRSKLQMLMAGAC